MNGGACAWMSHQQAIQARPLPHGTAALTHSRWRQREMAISVHTHTHARKHMVYIAKQTDMNIICVQNTITITLNILGTVMNRESTVGQIAQQYSAGPWPSGGCQLTKTIHPNAPLQPLMTLRDNVYCHTTQTAQEQPEERPRNAPRPNLLSSMGLVGCCC